MEQQSANEMRFCRQGELVEFMASLGYGFAAQDRSGSRFSICNVTFYRKSKLSSTWSEGRSRALLCEFKLHPEAPGADQIGAEEEPGSSTSGRETEEGQYIHVANVHLEGHPYKSKERINQVKSLLSRTELRLKQRGIGVNDAKLIVAGMLSISLRSDIRCLL
jgi:CCR4-NOT transcription complex subunit 6